MINVQQCFESDFVADCGQENRSILNSRTLPSLGFQRLLRGVTAEVDCCTSSNNPVNIASTDKVIRSAPIMMLTQSL